MRRFRFYNRHFYRFAVIALIWGSVLDVINVLTHGLGNDLSCLVAPDWSGGLSYALTLGATGVLLSFILENEERTFRLVERLHWNVRLLFNREHIYEIWWFFFWSLLGFGLSDALSDGWSRWHYGWSYGLYYGLTCGLITGLSYGVSIGLSRWLLFGLHQSVAPEEIEDEDRKKFNEGIYRSLRNGFCISVCSAIMIIGISLLVVMLSYALSSLLNSGLNNMLSCPLSKGPSYELNRLPSIVQNYIQNIVWLQAITGSVLVLAMFGGLAVFKHSVIRLLLHRHKTFPRRAKRFLEHVTRCNLMKREGGGYRFIHPRLLDYFADASPASVRERD